MTGIKLILLESWTTLSTVVSTLEVRVVLPVLFVTIISHSIQYLFLLGAIKFIQHVHQLDFPVRYYSSSIPRHIDDFIIVYNGREATKLPAYRHLDFSKIQQLVDSNKVGQRGNAQQSWGVASLNMRQANPGDLVNRPTIKTENITDGILPVFNTLSAIIDQMDPHYKFHCDRDDREERRKMFAEKLMEEDPYLSRKECCNNFIEGVSGISNVFWKRGSEVVSAMDIKRTLNDHGGKAVEKNKKKNYRNNFQQLLEKIGISLDDVAFLPHCDWFNAREPGHDFLCGVSRTVPISYGADTDMFDCPDDGFKLYRRDTFTGYNRKANEDAYEREDVATVLEARVKEVRAEKGYRNASFDKSLIEYLNDLTADDSNVDKRTGLAFAPTHSNKCLYYSLPATVAIRFQQSLNVHPLRLTEVLTVVAFANGIDKVHAYLAWAATCETLPYDTIVADYFQFCHELPDGSICSNGKAKRFQCHFRQSVSKLATVYGMRCLHDAIVQSNKGSIDRKALAKVCKEKVPMAGNLTTNHVLAVGVLAGWILDRKCLREANITDSLAKLVQAKMFNGDRKASISRIKKGAEMVGKALRLTGLAVEHSTCEAIRESPGLDGFKKGQRYLCISDTLDGDSSTITEVDSQAGWEAKLLRTEEFDRETLRSMNELPLDKVQHPWWEGPADPLLFTIKFVEECDRHGTDPFEVYSATLNGVAKQNDDDKRKRFRVFLKREKIEVSKLPSRVQAYLSGGKYIPHHLGDPSSEMGPPAEGVKHQSGTHRKKRKSKLMLQEKAYGETRLEVEQQQQASFRRSVPLDVIQYDTQFRPPKKMKVQSTSGGIRCVAIRLEDLATSAWSHKHGSTLPKVETLSFTAESGLQVISKIISHPSGTIQPADYPPCNLDTVAIHDESSRVVGFRKGKDAMAALHWWLSFHLRPKEVVKAWIKMILGSDERVIITRFGQGKQEWCRFERRMSDSLFVVFGERELLV